MFDHPNPRRESNLVFPPYSPCIRERLLAWKSDGRNIVPWGHYLVPGDTGVFDRVGGGIGAELDAEGIGRCLLGKEGLRMVSMECG